MRPGARASNRTGQDDRRRERGNRRQRDVESFGEFARLESPVRRQKNGDDERDGEQRRRETQREQQRRAPRCTPRGERDEGRRRQIDDEEPDERQRRAVREVGHALLRFRFSRISRSSSSRSARSRSETASTSDERTGSGSPSCWIRFWTSSVATAPSSSWRVAVARYTNARPTFSRASNPFLNSRSIVVMSVVYATVDPRRSQASRTVISCRCQANSITSRSREPRLRSRKSREDLKPQNRNRRIGLRIIGRWPPERRSSRAAIAASASRSAVGCSA